MNFCGTIRLQKRMQMTGFAMHCSMLAHKLLDLKYKRDNIDKTPAGDQIRMFVLTNEDRADFAKFAANLKWITSLETDTEAYWKEYAKHEYAAHDFFKLFDPLYVETKTAPVVALLERVGNGEELSEEEYKTAMEFLHMLSARAHAECDDGGCF